MKPVYEMTQEECLDYLGIVGSRNLMRLLVYNALKANGTAAIPVLPVSELREKVESDMTYLHERDPRIQNGFDPLYFDELLRTLDRRKQLKIDRARDRCWLTMDGRYVSGYMPLPVLERVLNGHQT